MSVALFLTVAALTSLRAPRAFSYAVLGLMAGCAIGFAAGIALAEHGLLRRLAMPFSPAYAASKGAVVQYTKALATAWAVDGITANAVLPGWIDTELTKNARWEVAGLNEHILARMPAKRWGVPADMSGVAAFLGGPASDFVTGTAIPVDGGYSVQV